MSQPDAPRSGGERGGVRWRRVLAEYAAAAGAVGLATVVRIATDPWLGNEYLFVFSYPVMIALAWYVRLGPLLVALALGLLAIDYLFVDPRGRLVPAAPAQWLQDVLYLVVGATAIFVASRARAARRHAAAVARRAHDAAARLAAQEQLLRQVLDNCGQAVRVADPDLTEVQYVSPAFEEIFGRPVSDAAASPTAWLEAVHPDDRAAVERSFAGLNGQLALEFRVVHPDGRIRWVRDRVFRVRDASGRPIRTVALAEDITERRLVHEALREREEFYRVLGEAAPDFVWAADPDGRLAYANARWHDYTGGALDEADGGDDWARAHPEDAARVAEQWARARREGQPFEVEYRSRRRDGHYRWFGARAAPVKDADGRIVRWIGIAVDIHDRRRAIEALGESEARYRAAFEMAAAGTARVDASTFRFLGVNRKFSEITGYAAHELLARTFYDVTHPDDRELGRESLDRLLRGETTEHTVEKRYVRRDGSIAWVHISASVVRAAEGRPLYLIGMVQDITARRQAEQALAASEERFRLALASGAVYVYEQDTDLRYVWVYPLSGLAHPDAIGRSDEELLGAEEAREITDIKRRVLRTGQPERRAVRIAVRGRAAWLELLVEARRDASGAIVGVGGTALDITEQTEAEQRIAALGDDLRRRVEELETLLRVLPVGVFISRDASCTEITMNPAGAAMLGLEPDANASKTGPTADALPFRVFREGREVPSADLPMQRAARLDVPVVGEDVDVHRADGSVVNLFEYASPLHDADGRVRGVVGVFVDITARRRAEGQLRRREEDYRFLAESIPQIVWTARPDGVTDYTNRRLLEYAGLSRDEMQRIGWIGLRHPDDREAATAAWNRAVQTGEPYEATYRLRRHDGEYRWHLARAVPMRDGHGRVIKWFGTCTDIDDRLRAEQALRDSERRFRELIDALPAAVYTTDAEGRITHYNAAAVELSGRRPRLGEDRLCVSWRVYRPDGTPLAREEWPMAITLRENRPVRGVEVLIERPEGTRIPCAPYPTPLRDESGALVGAVNMLVDLRDRKAAEEALRENAATLAAIGEVAPDFVWVSDAARQITYINRRWFDYTGLTLDELRAGGYSAILHPDDRERYAAESERALREGVPFEGEFRHRRHDGAYRWFWSRAMPLFGPDGRVAKRVGIAVDIHDRKAAEEALRASQAEYARLVGLMPAAVYVCDAEGRITFFNHHAAVLWGRAPALGDPNDRFCGAPRLRRPDGSPLPHDESPMAAALRTGVSFRGEALAIERPDGSRLDVQVNIDPIMDDRGRVVGAINAFHDVTARRRAEEAIRESEERFRTVADSAPVLMWLNDETGCTFVNRAYLEFLGLRDMSEVRGFDWTQHIHPDDRDEYVRAYRQAVAQRLPFERDLRFRRHDGDYRWMRTVAVPRLRGQEFLGYTGCTFDVHEARTAAAALRESEERFRTLAEAMPQIVWTARPDGVVDWHNRRWAEFSGASGRRPVLHEADRAGTTEAWRRATADGGDGGVYQVEHRLRRRDGEYRWHLTRAVPLRDPAGRIIKWFGTSTDIHEQKLAEEELARHRHHLEELVEQRTLELERSHEQLRLSERMAALGTLSLGLGHDMGNLLLPIRARLDILNARADLPPDVRENLEPIRTCAEYLQNLSRGLRLFALDPEDGAAAPEWTDLADWGREALPFFQNALGKRIEFHADLPAGLPAVALAPHRLTQAMLNLITNARDAIGRDRSGRVELRASVHDGPRGGVVHLSLADTGPGMSPEVKARCTEPFYTTKTRSVSTGLGLALVHGILQRTGGELAIDSAPGRGTTVTLILPTVEPAAREEPPGVAAISLRDVRIGSMLTGLLRAMGFEVEPAATETPDADLWLVDAVAISPDAVRRFLDCRPDRRVVVVGGDAGPWDGLPVIRVKPDGGLAPIRAAIARAWDHSASPPSAGVETAGAG